MVAMTNNILSSYFSEETKLLKNKIDELSSRETVNSVFVMADEVFEISHVGIYVNFIK
jgi:hypothetical protein